MVPVAGWKETQVSDMDFDTIMEKAYEEYFEGPGKIHEHARIYRLRSVAGSQILNFMS